MVVGAVATLALQRVLKRRAVARSTRSTLTSERFCQEGE
jgi:hypothetical protein